MSLCLNFVRFLRSLPVSILGHMTVPKDHKYSNCILPTDVFFHSHTHFQQNKEVVAR